jgi:hypothetical protein
MAEPEISFRHGPCSAAIFVNTVQKGDETIKVRSVVFQKSFQDEKGHWQTTSTLNVNDIPKATLVLNKAYEYLTSNIK